MVSFLERRTRIGGMRLRFTLEAPAQTPDGAGGNTRSFTYVADIWGHMMPRSGVEWWVADREEQNVTHQILIRYRTGITAGHRLKLGTRIFNIQALADTDGTARRLACLVEEISP